MRVATLVLAILVLILHVLGIVGSGISLWMIWSRFSGEVPAMMWFSFGWGLITNILTLVLCGLAIVLATGADGSERRDT
jgi:uncharacterized membrane protein